ncbi:MAG: DUF2603 domain-containing protein [Helicobacter sp.]|nr:DUF2603 domain-containing protein [Helicobacter sp.]
MARTKKIRGGSLDSHALILQGIESKLLRAKRENRATVHDEGACTDERGQQLWNRTIRPHAPFKDNEPYCMKMSGVDYMLLPEEMLCHLLDLLHASYEERYCMELEREIARQMPRDFDDIWEVAIEEIKKSNKGFLNIDPESLVLSIKKQHPNLFMRFDFDF